MRGRTAMAAIDDRTEATALHSGLWRRMSELFGVALLAAAVLLVLAMVSYDHGDPSWNHAVDAVQRNILGFAGASLADLLFQTLGAAAYLLPLVLLDWAVRLLLGRGLAWLWLRLVLVPPALILAAFALAIVPAPAGWPVAAG